MDLLTHAWTAVARRWPLPQPQLEQDPAFRRCRRPRARSDRTLHQPATADTHDRKAARSLRFRRPPRKSEILALRDRLGVDAGSLRRRDGLARLSDEPSRRL